MGAPAIACSAVRADRPSPSRSTPLPKKASCGWRQRVEEQRQSSRQAAGCDGRTHVHSGQRRQQGRRATCSSTVQLVTVCCKRGVDGREEKRKEHLLCVTTGSPADVRRCPAAACGGEVAPGPTSSASAALARGRETAQPAMRLSELRARRGADTTHRSVDSCSRPPVTRVSARLTSDCQSNLSGLHRGHCIYQHGSIHLHSPGPGFPLCRSFIRCVFHKAAQLRTRGQLC